MSLDIEAIIAKAAAAAREAAEKAGEKAEKVAKRREAAVDSPAARRLAAQARSKALVDAARQREAKQGLDLVEELLRDISPNVLRFLSREDADRLINSGVQLIINFSKTDEAPSVPSFTIRRSGSSKLNRTIHKASIEQWASSETMFLERYRREGGDPNISSHHELMLEIIRLTKENSRLRNIVEGSEETDAPLTDAVTA